ncbi:MAG: DUF3999 domain-containing protein [Thermogutta sp.]|nr:DUF3999 domain-containing protein [Thermogutta sp.]
MKRSASLWAAAVMVALGAAGMVRGGRLVCRASEFHFARPILVPETAQGGVALVAVALPDDVYAEAGEDLADVRILDSQGREIPRIIRKAFSQTGVTVRRYQTLYPGASVNLTPHPQGELDVVLKVPDEHPPIEGLRIGTPLRNFEQSVRVSTSEDGREWQPLVEAAVICDYSQWMNVRNLDIAFPRPASRHLRIVFSSLSVEHESEWRDVVRRLRDKQEIERTEETRIERRPFRLDRIDSWHRVVEAGKREPLQREVATEGFRAESDRSRKTTVVSVQMGRRPLAGLIVETKDRNFRRTVRVEIPRQGAVGRAWQTIADDAVMRLELPGYRWEDLTITFPEQRAEEYRLTIHDGDNEPLEITGIRGVTYVYQAVFLIEGTHRSEPKYRLCYGDEFAEPPDYDVAAVEAALSRNIEPLEARLGPAEQLAVAANPLRRLTKNVDTAALLIVLVLVLAAGMGWSLYRAAKRHPASPEE